MPKIKKGEKYKDWMSRCIPHLVNKEGKKHKQASAICISMWEDNEEGKDNG